MFKVENYLNTVLNASESQYNHILKMAYQSAHADVYGMIFPLARSVFLASILHNIQEIQGLKSFQKSDLEKFLTPDDDDFDIVYDLIIISKHVKLAKDESNRLVSQASMMYINSFIRKHNYFESSMLFALCEYDEKCDINVTPSIEKLRTHLLDSIAMIEKLHEITKKRLEG